MDHCIPSTPRAKLLAKLRAVALGRKDFGPAAGFAGTVDGPGMV